MKVDLPKHTDPNKRHGHVWRLSDDFNQRKADNTASNRQPPGSQNTHHPHLPTSGHIQTQSQRQREDKNDQITDHTDNGICQNNGCLVQTAATVILVPECRDWFADADLDYHGGDIVGQHDAQEDVDEDDGFAVRVEYTRHDPEEGQFGEVGGWAVCDHGCVDGL